MGFFDAFRKKKVSTPEEFLDRVQELERRISEEEEKLGQEIESRYRKRFERYWRFEEAFVLTRIRGVEDLFDMGVDPPAPEAIAESHEAGTLPDQDSGADRGAEDAPTEPSVDDLALAGEAEPSEERSDSGEGPSDAASAKASRTLSKEELRWIREILWQVWRRDNGHCHQCGGDNDIHFLPVAPESRDEGHDEPLFPSLESDPGGTPVPADSPTLQGDSSLDPAAVPGRSPQTEDRDLPVADDSMTRRILARLRLSCADCAPAAQQDAQKGVTSSVRS